MRGAAERSAAELASLTWPDVAARGSTTSLAIPLGSTEQHGPHLPLSTDTDVAVALAGRLAAARPDILVAPALAYGSSGEHAGFPGTLSIGSEALELLLVELVRSADAFRRVIIISAHGGNAAPVGRALDRLTAEGRRVMVWSPRGPGGASRPGSASGPGGSDAHAGHTETSVMLALAGDKVRIDRCAAGVTDPIDQLMPALRRGGVAAVSSNGVLGDPTGASEESGAGILDEWLADLLDAVDGWQ